MAPVTGFYLILCIGMLLWLMRAVILLRWRHRLPVGDGGHEDLLWAIRGHGNFVETVPAMLLLLLVAEVNGAPGWALHGLGLALVVGRGLHAWSGQGGFKLRYRMAGMLLTLGVLILGAALNAVLLL